MSATMEPVPVTAGALVSQVRGLLSPPNLYLQLRRLMDDPAAKIGDIGELISCDPATAARLLRIANSAMLGLTGPIETITRAVNVLGTQMVHDLVLSTSVTRSFAKLSTAVVDLRRYWASSVFCGLAARQLAEQCHVLDSERLFVEGLLRDIGHLVMYQVIPDLVGQARRESDARKLPIHVVERELLGYDFTDVGAELMDSWRLPPVLIAVTRDHMQPDRAREFRLETTIIHIASHLATAWDNEVPPDELQLPAGVERFVELLDIPAEKLAGIMASAAQGVSEARELFVVRQAA
jgi:HD-like signal output (HDOD) protein